MCAAADMVAACIYECMYFISLLISNRVRPRFSDQVVHKTMYAFSGNKHFFNKSCHRQTYQSYEERTKIGHNFKYFFGKIQLIFNTEK